MKKIWLSSPHMGGNEITYINEAFEQNMVSSLGPNVRLFEEGIEKFLNNDVDAVVLSSGTAALHLSLILAGVKSEDEVICQSLTFAASAFPILYLGARPVFVDSEQRTWNICPNYLEQCIKDRIKRGKCPKAIIAVHLYGMPAQIGDLLYLSNKYSIPLIEDAAEALGSSINTKFCGTFGEFGILSFNGNKIITTSGGGALLSKSPELIEKARFLSTQARDKAVHYEHTHVGYNYRMSNIAASIGRGQLEVLSSRINQRRNIFSLYQRELSNIDGITFLEEPDSFFSNRWLSTIIIDPHKTSGITKEDIRLRLESSDIECRPIWKPMHLQPIFADYPYYGESHSESFFNMGLCLPSGSDLVEEDVIYVADEIKKIIK